MTLVAGTRLGPYEIIAPLGKGGMGEVYRARDSRIGRDVALKILPELFAFDPERLARFEREAKALGGLNHPNIAAIYAVEGDASPAARKEGRSLALVMEFVDGEDLSLRIARGPIPWAEVLPIARQIADALSAAHDAGIVHRDLKPANIKVRDDGVVKVLDFGLAKAIDPSGSGSGEPVNSPTLTARATQLGMILGTAAYMAPEQAKAKAVDKRADIWAFGVVLYEMLTGRRAFEGDDVSDVLASVLKSDPDWTKLPEDVPPAMRRFLARCLEKDPRRRLRDIGEGMLQLDDSVAIAAGSGAMARPAGTSPAALAASSPPIPARPLWRRWLPVGVGALLATLATLGVVEMMRPPAVAPPPAVRFIIPTVPGAPFNATPATRDLAVTPDGRAVVYTVIAQGASGPSLQLRRFDQFDALALRGADAAVGPFVSPDSRSVAFVEATNSTRIKRVPVDGGTATQLAQLPVQVAGGTWTSGGLIVLGTNGSGLYKVSESGGEAVELTKLDEATGERSHRWPAWVPGTNIVLFTLGVGASNAAGRIAAVDLSTGQITRLPITGLSPRYVSTGHLVYTTADGVLRGVPFDINRLGTRGEPAPLIEGVNVKSSGAANFDVTMEGRLVYTTGSGTQADRTIVWVDRAARETPAKAPPRAYFYARISPDGDKISLDVRDQEADIWIWDSRGALRRLTQNTGSDQYGLWTPDGQRLVFQSDYQQKVGIYVTRADAIGAPTLLVERGAAFPNAITPDGKSLVFRASTAKTKNDLFIMPLDGPNATPTSLIATEHDELNAAISADGKWIAYESDVTGRTEVYVRPFPDVNAGQDLISIDGGQEPVFSPTGRELFFVGAGSRLMSVTYSLRANGTPNFTAPVPVFSAADYFFGGVGRNYDVSSDGKRFVMVKNPAVRSAAVEPLRAVLNWFEDLQRVK